MENNYVIINRNTIQTRIDELLVEAKELLKENDLEWQEEFLNYKDYSPDFEEYSDNSKYFYIIMGKIETYQELLFQSISLIPIIENAIQFGKDNRSENSFLDYTFGDPYIAYSDNIKETEDYISQLELNI